MKYIALILLGVVLLVSFPRFLAWQAGRNEANDVKQILQASGVSTDGLQKTTLSPGFDVYPITINNSQLQAMIVSLHLKQESYVPFCAEHFGNDYCAGGHVVDYRPGDGFEVRPPGARVPYDIKLFVRSGDSQAYLTADSPENAVPSFW